MAAEFLSHLAILTLSYASSCHKRYFATLLNMVSVVLEQCFNIVLSDSQCFNNYCMLKLFSFLHFKHVQGA